MSDSQKNSPDPVIACNPKAIPSDKRNDHEAVAKEIFSPTSVLEVKELADGYGLRLPLESQMLHKVMTFVANERLCCPFFTFTLVVGKAFWLELSGPPEVKAYIKAEIISALETQKFPTFAELEDAYSAATGLDS
jgi:hypothetical protein